MMELVNRNHDYSDKLVYFPNWCDDILQLPFEPVVSLPSGFNIMMAGNLNTGIGVDSVIALVNNLSDIDGLNFIFVGGGTKEAFIRNAFKEKGIKNVVMTGRLPFSKIPALYNQADAMLLTLKETSFQHLRATVPARLQSYMSAGKPILAMIDGCAADIINQADCGYAANAGDFKILSDYIRTFVMNHQQEFKEKGQLSRQFFEKYYQKSGCIDNLEHYLKFGGNTTPPYNIPKV